MQMNYKLKKKNTEQFKLNLQSCLCFAFGAFHINILNKQVTGFLIKKKSFISTVSDSTGSYSVLMKSAENDLQLNIKQSKYEAASEEMHSPPVSDGKNVFRIVEPPLHSDT